MSEKIKLLALWTSFFAVAFFRFAQFLLSLMPVTTLGVLVMSNDAYEAIEVMKAIGFNEPLAYLSILAYITIVAEWVLRMLARTSVDGDNHDSNGL